MERKVLGKGLSALIPERIVPPSSDKSEVVLYIDVSKVKPSMYQPRELFRKDRLDELISSIKEKGVVQPVLVRESAEGNYELIAGERRLRAVKEVGFDKIPAIIKKIDSDVDLLEMSLIENLQRENLNSIEEAHAYQRLVDEFSFTLENVGKRVGKDKTSISNTMRLLKLPKKIQDHITTDDISQGHGRALLSLGNEKRQLEICKKIIKKGLSVRETENLTTRKPGDFKKREKQKDGNIVAIEEELQRLFGTRVQISAFKKRGKIEIQYFSYDELDRILRVLRKCST